MYVEVLRYVAAMGGESMFGGRDDIVITASENAVLTIVCREFDISRPIDADGTWLSDSPIQWLMNYGVRNLIQPIFLNEII